MTKTMQMSTKPTMLCTLSKDNSVHYLRNTYLKVNIYMAMCAKIAIVNFCMTGGRLPNNIIKFSLYAVASAVNLNCTSQTSVCDGEEVVCNCTAPCSEPIHWWDNLTIVSFCSRTQLCNGNRQDCVPDISGSPPVRVEVINCSSTDTFTSRLS